MFSIKGISKFDPTPFFMSMIVILLTNNLLTFFYFKISGDGRD